MNAREIDSFYLLWLYSQVDNKPGEIDSNYMRLMEAMYSTEFTWNVPFDSNRAEDGKELRRDFVLDRGIRDAPADWMGMPCSFLEMVMGLADRMSRMLDKGVDKFFWLLLDNAGLAGQDEENFDSLYVEAKMYEIIDRVYDYNGNGGFFPLDETETDQSNVELLYQMYAYIQENYN